MEGNGAQHNKLKQNNENSQNKGVSNKNIAKKNNENESKENNNCYQSNNEMDCCIDPILHQAITYKLKLKSNIQIILTKSFALKNEFFTKNNNNGNADEDREDSIYCEGYYWWLCPKMLTVAGVGDVISLQYSRSQRRKHFYHDHDLQKKRKKHLS